MSRFAHWFLDPEVAHLNHGSFGAVPRPVQAAREEWLQRIEASPESFYRDRIHEALADARAQVARFLHARAADVTFVANVTEGVAVVLQSLDLGPSDNVVASDHTYEWVLLALQHLAAERQCSLRVVSAPDPLATDFEPALVEAFLKQVDRSTRLVVCDEITSKTSLRLPVARLAASLPRELPLLVDGAHAPGLLERPFVQGSAFWVGNLHKWAFAPRSVGVLVSPSGWHERLAPRVVSADAERPYPRNFDYQGTRDLTTILAVPAGLTFPQTHLGKSWQQLRRDNAQLAKQGAELLGQEWNCRVSPSGDLPLRTLHFPLTMGPEAALDLGARLRRRKIEVSTASWKGKLSLRISGQAYVAQEDFERLSAALRLELATA